MYILKVFIYIYTGFFQDKLRHSALSKTPQFRLDGNHSRGPGSNKILQRHSPVLQQMLEKILRFFERKPPGIWIAPQDQMHCVISLLLAPDRQKRQASSYRTQRSLLCIKQGEGHFGADVSAPPIRRWTTRGRDVSAPDISAPFPNFFLFFEL